MALGRPNAFFRIRNLCEALAIKFMMDNRLIAGSFVEEEEPPRQAWFQARTSASFWDKVRSFWASPDAGHPELPGDGIFAPEASAAGSPAAEASSVGTPAGTTRKIDWLDLLGRLAVRKDPARKLAENIIVLVKDFSTFTRIVRDHFVLRQGKLSFVSPDDKGGGWFLKINQPSIWALRKGGGVIFNEIPGAPELYLEAGWELAELRSPGSFERFKAVGKTTLLLSGSGSILPLKASWKDAFEIIEVKVPKAAVLTGDESARIRFSLGLRNVEKTPRPGFWEIRDIPRFRNILLATEFARLEGFSAWFTPGRVFVLQEANVAEPGLAEVFSDSFPAYYRRNPQIYLAAGREIVPALEEFRILKFFQVDGNQLLILGEEEGKMQSLVLPVIQKKKLTSFLEFYAEYASSQLDDFESRWRFDFPHVKKKALVIDLPEPGTGRKKKSGARSPEDERKVGDAPLPSLSLSDDEIQARERKQGVLARLRESDQKLLLETGNPDLWQDRAKLSLEAGFSDSACIAGLTAAAVRLDRRALLEQVREYCTESSEFSAIHSLNADETVKGQLLKKFRRTAVPAELHFSLGLLYSEKFRDNDIFLQVVQSMRTGYAQEKREFHKFAGSAFSSTGETGDLNFIHLMNDGKSEEIGANLAHFLEVVEGSASSATIAIVKRQFAILLEGRLNRMELLRLAGSEIRTNLFPLVLQRKWSDLEAFPDLPDLRKRSAGTREWVRVLAMERTESIGVKDIFSGERFRPVFEKSFNPEREAISVFSKFLQGAPDWSRYFTKAARGKTIMDKPESMRVLLKMVLENGSLGDFQKLILPFDSGNSFFNAIIMNCDIFRLNLLFQGITDEDAVLTALIDSLPSPSENYFDFRDAVEEVTCCVFLGREEKRQAFLDEILRKTLAWLEASRDDEDRVDELLVALFLLQSSVVMEFVPSSISFFTFQAKRRSIWMDFANSLYRGTV